MFSKFSNPEPDPRDFGIYGIFSTFSYLDPRNFGIFHSGFFSEFTNPQRVLGFLVFFDVAQKFFIIKNPDPESLGSEFGIRKNPIPKPTLSREVLAQV